MKQCLTNSMLTSMKECNVVQSIKRVADISKAVRIVIFQESVVSMISFVSLSKAVSVEWNLR